MMSTVVCTLLKSMLNTKNKKSCLGISKSILALKSYFLDLCSGVNSKGPVVTLDTHTLNILLNKCSGEAKWIKACIQMSTPTATI